MRLEELYRKSQTEIKNDVCKLYKGNAEASDGYVYIKGTVPVLLVAHMDTVHEKPVKDIVYTDKGNHISSPQGLGGDDRNGVYMIMEILREIPCHALFVEDEEIGLVGAKKFCKGFKGDLDINYIIYPLLFSF